MLNSQVLVRSWQSAEDCQHFQIKQVDLFANFENTELQQINHPIITTGFNQSDTLYQQGEQGGFIYNIQSGIIKLEVQSSAHSKKIVRLLFAGDIIGLEVLTGQAYHHTARVLEASQVCRIPVKLIHDLKIYSPKMCNNLMSQWAKSSMAADHWLNHLHTGRTRKRVLELIKFLIENSAKSPEFIIPSGEDMSSILDVSHETISRIIAELKREGKILDLGNGFFEAHL